MPIISVLIAIDLDDQFRLQATEVRHVRSNRHLSTKMSSIDRKPVPQVPPEFSLWFGLAMPQRPRPRALTNRRRLLRIVAPRYRQLATPTPNPSPQGGGE